MPGGSFISFLEQRVTGFIYNASLYNRDAVYFKAKKSSFKIIIVTLRAKEMFCYN
jgi:hypothetical protein